jgi:protein-S-isoprenylcysteine O-methyltransferase Ste14
MSTSQLPLLKYKNQVFVALEIGVTLLAVFLADPVQRSVVIGMIPFALGLALKLWSLGYENATDHKGEAGPYRFVRYPQVLSAFLILLGLCLATRSFYLTLLAMVVVTLQITLKIKFKDQESHWRDDVAFPRYQAIVPSVIPNLWPYPTTANQHFSWRQLVRTVGTNALPVVLLQVCGMVWVALVALNARLMPFNWLVAGGLTVVVLVRFLLSWRSR